MQEEKKHEKTEANTCQEESWWLECFVINKEMTSADPTWSAPVMTESV